MDPKTLELLRDLQADTHDEASFKRIRELLRTQRRALVSAHDQTTLGELCELLQAWAEAAETPPLRASALREAADILQRDLHRPERANELRRRAQEAIAEAEQRRVGSASYIALAQRRVASGELDGAIDAYERALSVEADPQVVRSLAELYVRRAGPEDAQQAADLYYTLGDVLGNPDGVVMLERALTQVPDHAEARALLAQYLEAQRPGGSSQAAADPPPLLIHVPLPLGGPIRASAPQLIAAAAQRARSAAPAPVSSISPVVRSEAPERVPERKPQGKRARWIASGGALIATAAAVALFVAAPRGSGRASIPTAGASVPVADGRTAGSSDPNAATGMGERGTGNGSAPTTGSKGADVAASDKGSASPTGTANSIGSAHANPSAAENATGTATPNAVATPTRNANVTGTANPTANANTNANATGIANSTGTPNANGTASATPSGPAITVAPSPADASKSAAHPTADGAHAASPSTRDANPTPTDPNAQQPASGPTVHALIELMTLRGGKLADPQLTAAIETLLPKIDKCYAQTLKQRPRTRGRLSFSWTVKPNGKVATVKQLGGSIKDPDLSRCSAQAIGTTRFPKPHKQAALIKLPVEFRRS